MLVVDVINSLRSIMAEQEHLVLRVPDDQNIETMRPELKDFGCFGYTCVVIKFT